MTESLYDAIVVGSGAAGAFAAYELTARGKSVLMLEAGPPVTPDCFVRHGKPPKNPINLWERAAATMAGQNVQARAMFFSKWMAHFYVNDRENPYTTPKDAPFLWIRGRQEGGRTHAFGRVLFRWSDDDFKTATRAGRGRDWPISYADLEPYYQEVETCLGLHGNNDGVASTPDSLCIAPATLTQAEAGFKADVEALHPEKSVIAWRHVPPRPDRILAPLQAAKDTGRLTIRRNAIVRRVIIDDETGLATGVEIIDRMSRQTQRFTAASVVLCASPIESVRLMWASACARHPHGLGNDTDQLGRYFMDQLPCVGAGTYPKARGFEAIPATDPFYDPTGGFFIMRDDVPMSDRLEYACQGSIARREGEVPDGPARMSFFAFAQMQPQADNRITLDPKVKDGWGIPAPHIRCKMSDADLQLLGRVENALIDLMQEQGAEFEFVGSARGLREMGPGAYPTADLLSRSLFRALFHKSMSIGASIHETGGAVMGDDPATSVLNGWGQCWGVPNLVVTDASAFASSGVTGTTLTVMAQTVRACRHLADHLPG
ncbi:MAG TPA: GMC family oxidoreductase [Paenirhodobacter sp.]